MVKPNSRTIRILSQHLNSSKTILRLIKKKDRYSSFTWREYNTGIHQYKKKK